MRSTKRSMPESGSDNKEKHDHSLYVRVGVIEISGRGLGVIAALVVFMALLTVSHSS